MLEPLLPILERKQIILASSSPRRKEILNMLGLKYQIVTSDFEENLNKDDFPTPVQYAIETSRRKAVDVAEILSKASKSADLIIAADTIVTVDNVIYGKPKDQADAIGILKKLNNRSHTVETGVTLLYPSNGKFLSRCFSETTLVHITGMTQSMMEGYVKTGEPMGKAGAYGIQGKGGSLIEKISGDYYNVMGFPLHKFCKELITLYTELGFVDKA
uniref:Putative nucleic acid-binding protein asmtl n=1 Tax=Ornithodoros turicata TaxID=34597 RepID=A0A2R5LMZ2_9ACAR